MLGELIDLLSCGSLETIERDEIVHLVQNAPQNPEFSWTSSPEEAMSIELISSLADYVATGDKVDELHELIQDMFDAPFPDFPHDLNADRPGERRVMLEYYEWMEQELAEWAVEQGGYDLIDATVHTPVCSWQSPKLLCQGNSQSPSHQLLRSGIQFQKPDRLELCESVQVIVIE
jgi:hypothetical protein